MLSPRQILYSLTCLVFVACEAGSNGEAPNQGALQQTAAGQIVANLSSRGIEKDPRFTGLSMIALYLYKKTDYSLSCTTAADRRACEDGLIFRNEKVDSLGFTNEPGYFGYEPSYDPARYYPNLVAADGYNYPQTKPADPPGFADPDVWQCLYSGFQGGFACGVNSHPIRYFNKKLTTYTLQVYATNGQGFASSYILDYNLFNSLNHPVKDGDRYYAYFAVHFNAMKSAADSEDRFDATASTWKRPIEPDLVSPRIEVKVKLLPEGPYDRAGSVYDIPDYSTWYDPLAGCRAAQSVPANSVYISEIMWMGSKSVSGAGALEDEFIEIYNSNAFDVSISGWKLLGAGTSSEAIVLPTCAVIKAGGVYTVGAQTTKAYTKLDYTNAKFSLSNSGESTFGLTDANSTPVYSHTITNCTTGPWGGFGENGGAGVPKRSMRLINRNTPSATCASGWTTSGRADAGYGAGSVNISSNYLYPETKPDNSSGDGTLATPGFAGPL